MKAFNIKKINNINKEIELKLYYILVLRKAFEAFDQEKKGCIGTVMVGTILGMLGHQVSDDTLQEIINEVDVDGEYFDK